MDNIANEGNCMRLNRCDRCMATTEFSALERSDWVRIGYSSLTTEENIVFPGLELCPSCWSFIQDKLKTPPAKVQQGAISDF